MNAGDVFQFQGGAERHAWVIISDPAVDPEHVLMVNFTTWDPHIDQACVLEPGDHPFITTRTCVNYPRAKEVSDDALEQYGRPPDFAFCLPSLRRCSAGCVRGPCSRG